MMWVQRLGVVVFFCFVWVGFFVGFFWGGGEGNCLKKTLTSASVAYSPSGLPVKGFFQKSRTLIKGRPFRTSEFI